MNDQTIYQRSRSVMFFFLGSTAGCAIANLLGASVYFLVASSMLLAVSAIVCWHSMSEDKA